MNAATKLALGFLLLLVIGLALVMAGLWPHYRVAAVMVGALCVMAGAICFAALWRER